MTELLPCPFCGGEAGMYADDYMFRAYCGRCSCEGPTSHIGAEQAADLWNERDTTNRDVLP